MIRRGVYGNHHVLVAETLHNIGVLLYQQEQFEEACPLLEETLRIKEYACQSIHSDVRDGAVVKEKKLHTANLSVSNTCQALGAVYHRLGNLKSARTQYDRALAIRVEVLDNNHSDILAIRKNLRLLDALERGEMEYLMEGSVDGSNSLLTLGQESDISFTIPVQLM